MVVLLLELFLVGSILGLSKFLSVWIRKRIIYDAFTTGPHILISSF